MMTIIALVCTMGGALLDCTPANAIKVVRGQQVSAAQCNEIELRWRRGAMFSPKGTTSPVLMSMLPDGVPDGQRARLMCE